MALDRISVWLLPAEPSRRTIAIRFLCVLGAVIVTAALFLIVTVAHWPEAVAAAEALIGMGLAGVGTLTGALHTPSREALEPLRAFPTIYLWPDNDSIGVRHMERIAQRLHTLGAKNIKVIRWAGPRKGDAADFQEGEVGVRALMKDARVWKADSKLRNRGQLSLRSTRVPVSLELPLGVRAPRLSIEPFSRKPSALRRPPPDAAKARAAVAAPKESSYGQ